MTPAPSNAFTIGDAQWTRILSLIQRKWADGEIMRVTGFKLSAIAAIRADFERVVG